MFKGQGWFEYLDKPMRELVEEAYYLLDREEVAGESLVDYSFVVFPMAKAYEGFVKKYLFDIGLLDEKTYLGKQFRIGRSLNPGLPEKYRDEWWLFDDMVERCREGMGKKAKNLPMKMWKAWKEGRNRIFHYFVGEEGEIDLVKARERIESFREVMEQAFDCKMEVSNREN